MNPPQEFWDQQKGLVLVTTDGTLRFTGAGKSRYAVRLAKHGFTLRNVKTIERLYEVMTQVTTWELDAENGGSEHSFVEPNIDEREIIARLMRKALSKSAVVSNADLPTTGEADLHT